MKINIYTSHPSAFISSTFIDLEEERSAVANVLNASNLNINALDVKPASNDSSRKEILTGIKESDFIILIIGERYGSIIPRMTLSKKFSITRWEYVRAVQTYKKHVLVYFKRVESNDPMYYDDSQSDDFKVKRMHLAAFKKELSNAHNPKYFTTTEELAEEVRKAIIPTYRAGVKSLSAKNESLTKELEALKLENQRLTVASTTIADGSLAGLSDFAKTRPTGLLGMVNDGQNSISNVSGLGLLSQFTNRENKK